MSRRPSQLSRIEARLDRIEELVTAARLDIVSLKVKSGVWGGIAGLTAAGLVVIGYLLTM